MYMTSLKFRYYLVQHLLKQKHSPRTNISRSHQNIINQTTQFSDLYCVCAHRAFINFKAWSIFINMFFFLNLLNWKIVLSVDTVNSSVIVLGSRKKSQYPINGFIMIILNMQVTFLAHHFYNPFFRVSVRNAHTNH